MKKIIALLLLLVLILPTVAEAAAWVAADSFESYSTGSVNADNGGSGWTGAYSVAGGTCDVSTTVAHGGTKSLHYTSTATSCDYSRAMTAVTSGTFTFYVDSVNAPTGTKGWYPVIIREGATFRFLIGWGVPGVTGNNVGISGDNVTFTTIATSPTANTFHSITIDIDQPNNRARASFDGGAYSAYVTANGGSFSTLDTWRGATADGNASDQGYYIDDITPVVVTATAGTAYFFKGLNVVVKGLNISFF